MKRAMICHVCGAEIPDTAAVCPVCHAPIEFTADLIRRAKENDQEAIAELYNRTYSSVYYTVRTMLREEDEALDVVQDSYLKAFRNLGQLDDPSKFRAWVRQIARNRAADVLRQNRPVLFSELESDDEVPAEFEDPDPAHLPEAAVDLQETSRLLGEILDALPADQRAVISLFYYEQMSVKEISRELGISENTVKSRLNYGRKKIEVRVRALAERGTKLYGLAPVPFLLLLFRSREGYAAPAKAASLLSGIREGLGTTAASSAVGKTAAHAAGNAVRRAVKARIAAGVTAAAVAVGGGAAAVHHLAQRQPAPIAETAEDAGPEAQILPDDFLLDMEELTERKLGTLLTDRDTLELGVPEGLLDVPAEVMRAENVRLTKDAVYCETGGAAVLYLVCEGDVRIAESWEGFIVNRVPSEYPDAAIVFTLDAFPLKFLREDGSIVYTEQDFSLFRIFPSREAFETELIERYRYVTHERYPIRLP